MKISNIALIILIPMCMVLWVANYDMKHRLTDTTVKLVRGFKNTGNWDSVYLYSDGHLSIIKNADTVKPNRYFLISYLYAMKEYTGTFNGNVWFECTEFPHKSEIDSLVFNGLEYKKSCYQPIVISSIYEFKNRDEYLIFDYNYVGDKVSNKKMSCR